MIKTMQIEHLPEGFHSVTAINKQQIEAWIQIKDEAGALKIERDEAALQEESYLDGCYVIKTDLKENEADTNLVHDQYKDLSEMEKVFRGGRR